jgi:uncharacterized surface protein with fasciclin (FAS1) repeats
MVYPTSDDIAAEGKQSSEVIHVHYQPTATAVRMSAPDVESQVPASTCRCCCAKNHNLKKMATATLVLLFIVSTIVTVMVINKPTSHTPIVMISTVIPMTKQPTPYPTYAPVTPAPTEHPAPYPETEVYPEGGMEEPGSWLNANPDFSTLVAAVTAAGLVETLSGEGPFTVFAPTNDAFGSLPEGTVDTLLLPENIDQLTDILKYHVVSGYFPSSSIESGVWTVETLNGDSITVDVSDAGIMVNDANVIRADIMASNGVIHVIDKLLMHIAFA